MTIATHEPAATRSASGLLPTRQEAFVMLAAAALVLAVLLPTLGKLAFWYDEIITAEVTELHWPRLVYERLTKGHFPTYFAFMKGVGLGGASEFWLRLPSAIASAGAASVLALIALRFLGPVATATTILLYAALPVLINYGQEARPYAAMLFFLTLSMFAHMSMLSGRPGLERQGWLATFGVLGTALVIPAGIVAVAMQHLGLLLCGIRQAPEAERKVWYRHLKVSWGVILVAALLLVPTAIRQSRGTQGLKKWQVLTPDSERFYESFRLIYGFAVDPDPNRFLPAGYETWLSLLLLLLIAIGAILGLRRKETRYLTVIAIGTPVAFTAIGLFYVSAARYVLGMMPATVLLVGVAVAFLLSRPILRIPAGLILAIAAVALWLQAFDMLIAERKLDWRKVATFLHDNGIRDTELLLSSDQILRDLNHYLPISDGITFRYVTPPLQTMDTIWKAAETRDLAWLLLFYTDNLPPEVSYGRLVCRWQFDYLTVFAAARDPALLPPSLKDCGTAPP